MQSTSGRTALMRCQTYQASTSQCPVKVNVRARFSGARLPRTRSNGAQWRAQWLENSAEVDVPVKVEHCYALWEDRERIPTWMPWISSVKVLDNDPRMSRWTLSTNQFNRKWEFSWLAQNLTPTRLQKIHWRSVQGSSGGSLGSAIDVANAGQIRFYRKSPSDCRVKLSISYEVPLVLSPMAGLLTPIVESILRTDLGRFREYAVQTQARGQHVGGA